MLIADDLLVTQLVESYLVTFDKTLKWILSGMPFKSLAGTQLTGFAHFFQNWQGLETVYKNS
ncbi:MAG: hypothetical protein DCF22_06210 [Leptolyngbya sp.]|nr:MAG: hypothetical protein DCF22_06210 [Leptolyngbya sp.]